MKSTYYSAEGVQSKSTKIYDTITDTMIELLESLKTNPEHWEKPWILAENGLGAHNAVSKRPYSGINQLILSYLCLKHGYNVNRWLTFKQVQDLGGKVKKDQKSTMIVFSKRTQIIGKEDKQSDLDDSEDINEEKTTLRTRFILTYYNVFNVSQCEGIGVNFCIPYIKIENEFNCIDVAEELMNKCGARIQYCEQNKAFYTLGLDLISLPNRKQFKTVAGFYQTAFHEIGHWSGHTSRLNRKLFNMFGSKDYAREELTAEMCSVFINSLCGIEIKIKNSAVYIDSWLDALRDDKTAFIRSTMQAQTAANFILEHSGMEHLKQLPNEEKNQVGDLEQSYAA